MTVWTVLGLAALALVLLFLSLRLRRASGLPAGEIIASDTSTWLPNAETLRSEALGLVGRPDYLARLREGVIPVEVKSGRAPAEPHAGHRLQLGAYCLLVAERYGRRPPYGIIRYADHTFKVPFDRALEGATRATVQALRDSAIAPDGPARSHRDPGRCARCGVAGHCDQSI